MKRILTYFLCSTFLLTSVCAGVQNLRSFCFFQANYDPNTLVIFDIDHVLLTPFDRCLQPDGIKYMKEQLSSLDAEESEELICKIFASSKERIYDNRTADRVRKLHKGKVPTFALAVQSPYFKEDRESFLEGRVAKLKENGIDFSSFAFKGFKERSSIMYKNGVFLINELTKADALALILEKLAVIPEKVVMVGQDLGELYKVEEMLKSVGIEFQGFHYVKVKREFRFNPTIADAQLYHLKKKGVWLDEKQARERYVFMIKGK